MACPGEQSENKCSKGGKSKCQVDIVAVATAVPIVFQARGAFHIVLLPDTLHLPIIPVSEVLRRILIEAE